MTIRMLKPYNGYFEGQIVPGLSGAEETRLIGLGFAVADLDGPREDGGLARFSADSSGKPTSIADGRGGIIRLYPQKRTGVYIGDSVVALGSNASLGYRNAKSVLQHALRKIGRPVRIVNEIGYSGKRTDEIFANWDTAVTPHNPGVVFWQSGVNDFNAAATPQAVFERLLAVKDRAVKEGRRFVYLGMPPMPYHGDALVLLNKIRNYALIDRTFEYVGASESLLDYNSTPAQIAAGRTLPTTLPDGTHPSAKGANIWGSRLGVRLINIGLVPDPTQAVMVSDGTEGEYMTNPIENGLVGASGAGFVGEVTPANARTIASSVRDMDPANNLQKLLPGRLFRTVFAPGTGPGVADRMANTNWTNRTSGADRYAGKRYIAKGYIKGVATGGTIRGISLRAEVYDWSYNYLTGSDDCAMFDPTDVTGEWLLAATEYEGLFETSEFAFPATWTDPTKLHIALRAIVYADIGATVTLDIGCAEFEEIA